MEVRVRVRPVVPIDPRGPSAGGRGGSGSPCRLNSAAPSTASSKRKRCLDLQKAVAICSSGGEGRVLKAGNGDTERIAGHAQEIQPVEFDNRK